jgi:hypothetical protein
VRAPARRFTLLVGKKKYIGKQNRQPDCNMSVQSDCSPTTEFTVPHVPHISESRLRGSEEGVGMPELWCNAVAVEGRRAFPVACYAGQPQSGHPPSQQAGSPVLQFAPKPPFADIAHSSHPVGSSEPKTSRESTYRCQRAHLPHLGGCHRSPRCRAARRTCHHRCRCC